MATKEEYLKAAAEVPRVFYVRFLYNLVRAQEEAKIVGFESFVNLSEYVEEWSKGASRSELQRAIKGIAKSSELLSALACVTFAERIGDWHESKVRRARKGAEQKAAKSPAYSAKMKAIALWPKAQRMGWTAIRVHQELLKDGHSVSQDTVRKWVTKLRNTGIC